MYGRGLLDQLEGSSRPASCCLQWPNRCLQEALKQGAKSAAPSLDPPSSKQPLKDSLPLKLEVLSSSLA